MSAGDELRATAQRLRNIPKQIGKAQSRALRKAAAQTKTETSRVIRTEVNLKKNYVDQQLLVKIAEVADGTVTAIISAKKRGILLTRFPWSQIKKSRKPAGVRVKVSPGNSEIFRHAFPIILSLSYGGGGDLSGNVGLAVRRGPDYQRFPLDVLHGPSVSQVFATFLPTLKTYAAERYDTVFKQELRFALGTE